MEKANVSVNQITELFHITSLKELSVDQFTKCMNKLEKTIEQNGDS